MVKLSHKTIAGHSIFTRAGKPGDMTIVEDVLEDDGYGLKSILGQYPELADEEFTIIDVGGHIGSFAIAALSLFKKAKLLAFEPLEEAFNVYQENMKRFHDRNIVIYNRAVSYSFEKLTLAASADPSEFTGNIMAVSVCPDGCENLNIEVATITLEDALRESGLEATKYLLKLDCECGEWDILSNISPKLAEKIFTVLGEWHDYDCHKILTVSGKVFPHLYTSTFFCGTTYGNFWSIPYDACGKHFYADTLSLRAQNKIMETYTLPQRTLLIKKVVRKIKRIFS